MADAAEASRPEIRTRLPGNRFKKVVILYRPAQDYIDILRVVHGSRDLQTLLRREGV